MLLKIQQNRHPTPSDHVQCVTMTTKVNFHEGTLVVFTRCSWRTLSYKSNDVKLVFTRCSCLTLTSMFNVSSLHILLYLSFFLFFFSSSSYTYFASQLSLRNYSLLFRVCIQDYRRGNFWNRCQNDRWWRRHQGGRRSCWNSLYLWAPQTAQGETEADGASEISWQEAQEGKKKELVI